MDSSVPITIILMGIQGSGKGTQAQLLKERLGFVGLDAGHLLRKKSQESSEIGRKISEILASGQLIPNEITAPIVLDELIKIDERKPLVIDGFPRTKENADSLEDMLLTSGRKSSAVVVNINLAEESAIGRLASRKVCSNCGKIFGSTELLLCDNCGGELKKRSDSSEEATRKRLQWHWTSVNPIIEQYRHQYPFYDIDGNQPVEQVYQSIVTALGLRQ